LSYSPSASGSWASGSFSSPSYHRYGSIILAWITIFSINVFTAVYALHRKLFLKDTGRKLSHIDKQVVAGHSPVPTAMPEGEAH